MEVILKSHGFKVNDSPSGLRIELEAKTYEEILTKLTLLSADFTRIQQINIPEILKLRHDTSRIVATRQRIYDALTCDAFPRITSQLCIEAIRLIDLHFLSGYLLNNGFEPHLKCGSTTNGCLHVVISKRMKKTCASLSIKDGVHCISISEELLQTITPQTIDLVFDNTATRIKSRVQALIIALEHELCHLILEICPFRRNCKPHGEEFQNLSHNIFGHVTHRHELASLPNLSNIDLERQRLDPPTFSNALGAEVAFELHQGKVHDVCADYAIVHTHDSVYHTPYSSLFWVR